MKEKHSFDRSCYNTLPTIGALTTNNTRMKNIGIYIFFLVSTIAFTSCDQATWDKILEAGTESILSEEQISSALKQALDKGVDKGVQYLGKSGGFSSSQYKIFLPEEAQTVAEKLRVIPGFNQFEDIMIQKINDSAEDAVKKATPIFVGAIKEMTITDAMDILMGDDNAATSYLNRKTRESLYGEFEPVVVNSLNKFGALDYYTDAVTKYNSLPFVSDINPSLQDYVVTQALNALFDRIEAEELNIRENVAARTTNLLKKVFAKQDNR